MAMPHADDAPRFAARRPDQYHQPLIQPPRADESWLSIVLPIINAGQMQPGKDFLGSSQVEPALAHRPLPLGAIAGNAHVLSVATFNRAVNGTARHGATSCCWLTSAISGGAQSARRLLIATRPRRRLSLQAACRRATTAASHS